jgi:hypothetical protein
MDVFGLKEIATTLIVGSFTILIVEFVVYFTFGVPITHVFDRSFRRHRKRDTQVFLFACFALGLITEDILWKSRSAVDLGGKARWILCRNSIFEDLSDEPKDVTRVRLESAVLVRGFSGSPKVTPLAKQLADNQVFRAIDGKRGERVEAWLTGDAKDCSESAKNEFEASMQKVWYEAHNRVFQIEGYREEMTRIETRQRFSGTLSELAYTALWVALIGGLAMLFAMLTIARSHSIREWLRSRLPTYPLRFRALLMLPPTNLVRRSFRYVLILALRCLLLYAIYFFSVWAHTRESLEFNKRTFGYFNSLAFEARNQTSGSPVSPRGPR